MNYPLSSERPRKDMDRREFLRIVSASVPLSAYLLQTPAKSRASFFAQTPRSPEDLSALISRQKSPDNLESPFAALSDFITPNNRFYVRSHFPVPQIELANWRLRIEGAVERPLELSYEDLLKMSAQTYVATLECAGNSRSFLSPAVKGVQWALGAVSNASWTGVPLRALLKKAGVQRHAVEVILEGADSGEIKDPPKPTGAIHFARSLSLKKAMQPEVLIAYKMNGETLSPSHGYPARAIVPGWYAVASIKWLTRIIVTDKPFHGHFQTVDYAIWERSQGVPNRIPITEMQTKAEIANPIAAEKIKANSVYRVHGAAWTGEAELAKVEVSVDGGRSWQLATLQGRSARHAWRLWEFSWKTPSQTGAVTLMARATNTHGETQPMQRPPDRENYMISHVLPVLVEII